MSAGRGWLSSLPDAVCQECRLLAERQMPQNAFHSASTCASDRP